MSLQNRCANSFNGQVRQRGQSYYSAGFVVPQVARDDQFIASVAGSRKYTVSLSWALDFDDQFIEAQCTCPYYAGGALCKHIWAALLAADDQYRSQKTFVGSGHLPVEPADDFGDVDDVFYDYEEDDKEIDARSVATVHKFPTAEPRSKDWRHALECLRLPDHGSWPGATTSRRPPPKPGRLWYLLDIESIRQSGLVSIALCQQELNAKGVWGKIKEARLELNELSPMGDAADRDALHTLLGCVAREPPKQYYYRPQQERKTHIELQPSAQASVLACLAATGRLIYKHDSQRVAGDQQPPTLAWDTGEAYRAHFQIEPAAAAKSTIGNWQINGTLERAGEVLDLAEPILITSSGAVFFVDRVAQWQGLSQGAFQWLVAIRQMGPMQLPAKDVDQFIRSLKDAASLPPLRVPTEFPWQISIEQPTPKLVIMPPARHGGLNQAFIEGALQFVYGAEDAIMQGRHLVIDAANKRLILRHQDFEDAVRARLMSFGAPAERLSGSDKDGEGDRYVFRLDGFAEAVEAFDRDGWLVVAGTGRVKRATHPAIKVTSSPSGIDWFDVHASVSFDGEELPLPKLLAALKRGEHFVRLGDGNLGILPQDWLRRFASLSRLGSADGDAWRFSGNQALLLDALLAAEPLVNADASFATIRARFKSFAGITPVRAPTGFVGTLRPYQEAGFAWLRFLADFGLGGCLADDMGLGKTIQVLALLQERLGVTPRLPSVIVVPKSLVYNWVEEAARFTPSLRVGVYAGPDRASLLLPDAGVDAIVMTYNMMRIDILRLSTITFDYAILDEAQHIKNEGAQVAKAARLLKARHRLAMSGTPVENHLRELGSLFEFLNPGMLGDVLAPVKTRGVELDAGSVAVLGAALRPLILRRTKEQVLPDLPAKTEQTLLCDFEPAEAKAYDELRRHYQAALSQKIDRDGIAKTKIVVLEALLRLRQAACHPGLIDKSKTSASSAKVDLLLEQLTEVVSGGHKALVFSQFTSLLAIAKKRLEAAGITYEYLDGKTRDRRAKVERFQTDTQCSVFLISLKAGGVGLNLTAADYCYILDPWWNPAAEAQAIDRAHRIGQTKRVFAYRLITRGTVEEKIVLLQQKKKQLADAIVQADESFLAAMTAADLESLLSPS